MRWLGVSVACIGALAIAGCDPASDQYFREGVGADLNSGQLPAAADLNSGQLPQATQQQDEYVYYICRQAGSSMTTGATGWAHGSRSVV